MRRATLEGVFLSLITATVAQATMITVNFNEPGLIADSLPPPDGTGSPTILTDQLSYLGVTFSVPDTSKGVAYVAGPGDVPGIVGDGFWDHALAVNTLPKNSAANATTLSISFIAGTRGDTISFDANDTENSVLFSLYDGSTMVEQIPWTSVDTYQHIAFTYSGLITRVDIFDGTATGGDGDGFIIDNLRYDAADIELPEPVQMIPLGMALALLAYLRRISLRRGRTPGGRL